MKDLNGAFPRTPESIEEAIHEGIRRGRRRELRRARLRRAACVAAALHRPWRKSGAFQAERVRERPALSRAHAKSRHRYTRAYRHRAACVDRYRSAPGNACGDGDLWACGY